MHGLLVLMLAATSVLRAQFETHHDAPGRIGGSSRRSLDLDGLDATLKAEIQDDLAAGAFDAAERVILLRLERDHEAGRLLVVIGAIYFLDKKYLESAIAYNKARQYEHLSERDQFTLAMDYVELGKTTWARRQLVDLISDQPAKPLYRYWLGRIDYDKQQFSQAKESYKEVLKGDPDYVRAYDGLGLCSEALGELIDAEEYYRHANELNRKQPTRLSWPPINYGSFLRKQGRFAEARRFLKALT